MAEPYSAPLAELLGRSYPPDADALRGQPSRSERLDRLLRETIDRAALSLERYVERRGRDRARQRPATETKTDPADPGPRRSGRAGGAAPVSRAKSLRTRLRELEVDHEKAVSWVGAAHRREAERVASEVLHDGADIWRVDPELQQRFYDQEFGEVTRDSVIEAAKQLIASRPHLGRPPTGKPPSDRLIEGLRPGARAEETTPKPTWYSAIRGG